MGGAWRQAVWLEIANPTRLPVALTGTPQMSVALTDATGEAVHPVQPLVGNGPQAEDGTLVVPAGGYLGLRVDDRSLGVPPHGVLLALGGEAWCLTPGRYRLRVTARLADGITVDPVPVVLEVTRRS